MNSDSVSNFKKVIIGINSVYEDINSNSKIPIRNRGISKFANSVALSLKADGLLPSAFANLLNTIREIHIHEMPSNVKDDIIADMSLSFCQNNDGEKLASMDSSKKCDVSASDNIHSSEKGDNHSSKNHDDRNSENFPNVSQKSDQSKLDMLSNICTTEVIATKSHNKKVCILKDNLVIHDKRKEQVSSEIDVKKETKISWKKCEKVYYKNEDDAMKELTNSFRVKYTKKSENGDRTRFYTCYEENCYAKMCIFISKEKSYVSKYGTCYHDVSSKVKNGLSRDILEHIDIFCKRASQDSNTSKDDVQCQAVWRQLVQKYEKDARFKLPKTCNEIHGQVSNRIKYFKRKLCNNKNVNCKHSERFQICDSITLQKHSESIRLTYPKSPFPIPKDTFEIEKICKELNIEDTSSKVGDEKSPGRVMVSLKNPSIDECPPMTEAFEKEVKKDDINKMLVFTSMNLLLNICDADRKLKMKIIGSIDGTHSISANGYTLLVFGTFAFGRHQKGTSKNWTNSFRPFAYCFCPTECEAAAIVMMCAVNYAMTALFNIKVDFKIGVVSDRADAFCNAYSLVYPESLRAQCWPHVSFKFQHGNIYNDGSKKKPTQTYKDYLIDQGNLNWLVSTARADVKLLHLCRSHQMFAPLWKVIKDAWIKYGEKDIARIFGKSYADNARYSQFRYNTFNIPGVLPNDNPTERFNRSIKGTRFEKGMIQVGRKFNDTILEEFPKLVYFASVDKCGVYRDYQMSSSTNIEYEDAFEASKLKKNVDIKGDGEGGFFVNSTEYAGQPITEERLLEYKQIINGNYPVSYESKNNYIDKVHSICHVTLHKIENEQLIWMGNCTDSFRSTKCPHAIKIAYSIEADLKVQQYIPQIIKKSTKKRNRQEHTKKDLTKKSGESSKVPMEHKGGNNAFTGNSIRINGQAQPPPPMWRWGGC